LRAAAQLKDLGKGALHPGFDNGGIRRQRFAIVSDGLCGGYFLASLGDFAATQIVANCIL
jgi:hypothetical protein